MVVIGSQGCYLRSNLHIGDTGSPPCFVFQPILFPPGGVQVCGVGLAEVLDGGAERGGGSRARRGVALHPAHLGRGGAHGPARVRPRSHGHPAQGRHPGGLALQSRKRLTSSRTNVCQGEGCKCEFLALKLSWAA